MTKNAVVITDEALADMNDIYDYIAYSLLAPEAAMRQYNRIANAIQKLELFPERYALFSCEPEHSMGLRKMKIDNYMVCFIVDPGVVTVTDVLYGASDIHSKLKHRHK